MSIKNYSSHEIYKEGEKILAETKMPSNIKLVMKFIENVKKQVNAPDAAIKAGYEAGCLGYSLYWQLEEKRDRL